MRPRRCDCEKSINNFSQIVKKVLDNGSLLLQRRFESGLTQSNLAGLIVKTES